MREYECIKMNQTDLSLTFDIVKTFKIFAQKDHLNCNIDEEVYQVL